MNEDLAVYLRGWIGKKYQEGQTDCRPYVAGWIKQKTGKTIPAAPYRTRRGAVFHYKTNKGFERKITALHSCLKENGQPQTGNVVLLRVGKRPYLGLCVGDKLMVRTETGIADALAQYNAVEVVKVWSVEE